MTKGDAPPIIQEDILNIKVLENQIIWRPRRYADRARIGKEAADYELE